MQLIQSWNSYLNLPSEERYASFTKNVYELNGVVRNQFPLVGNGAFTAMHNLIPMLTDIGATGICADASCYVKIRYGFGHSIEIVPLGHSQVLIVLKDCFHKIEQLSCKPCDAKTMFHFFFAKHELQFKCGQRIRRQIRKTFPQWKLSACDYGFGLYKSKTNVFYVCVLPNNTIQIIFKIPTIFNSFKEAYPFLQSLD